MNETNTEKEIADPLVADRSFEEMNLSREIADAIADLGFESPTPVQDRTYDPAMRGADLIVMAQTGTGKTAAFGIPMCERLDPTVGDAQGLVLTPTRELALQVCRELEAIGKHRKIKSTPIYGGASFTNQVSDIEAGTQIIVGTPGRVLDHIRRRTLGFGSLGMLVLDEADEMLSMGFEKEISQIIEALPKSRQTLLFSATIPDDIRRLSKRYMGEAEIISVSGDEIGAQQVSHFMYLATGHDRHADLVKVLELEQPTSALIFCNTRDETQSVAKYLKRAGYNAEWINSNLSQNDREKVMRATREERIQLLVATDVAARGIDVSHLSHVINFSFPESLEIYIHRTGRTGRAGRQGTAISLITPQNIGNLYYLRLTYKIFPVEKTLPNAASEAKLADLRKLDQLRRSLADENDPDVTRLARRLLQHAQADQIVAGLLRAYFGDHGPKSKRQERDSAEEPRRSRKRRQNKQKDRRDRRPSEAVEDGDIKPETARSEEPAPADVASDKPAPAAEPREDRRPRRESKSAPPAEPSPRAEEPVDTREIYLDAGRKDGLRISNMMKEIVSRCGLQRADLGKVRMLTRSTFIAIPVQHFDAVVDALQGIEIQDRVIKVEPAENT